MQNNKKQLNIKNNWKKIKLSDIANIKRGGSPRPIESYITKNEDGLNWLRIGDINSGSKYIYKTTEKIKKEGLKKTLLVNDGDFILSNSMSFGRPYIMKISTCIHDGWLALMNIKKDIISKDFLYYLLSSHKVQNLFYSFSAGSGVQNLKKEIVEKIPVTIPLISEQNRIVSVLETWDKLIEKLEKKINIKKNIKKGLMQVLLTGRKRLKGFNEKWEESKLKDLCIYKNGGSFEKNIDKNGKYNLITLNSIDINGMLKNEHKKVNFADWYLEENDLIMVLSDVAHGNFLGLVDIIPENNKYVLNQRMGLLRKTNNNIDLDFLRFYINNNQLYFKSCGQGSSQLNLSKSDVEDFKILIPKLEEQKIVSDILVKSHKEIELLNKKLDLLKNQRKYLLNKLITGEIRTPENLPIYS